MDLAGVALLLIVALGAVIVIVILLTRGVFARDLTNALRRVTQQEQALQDKAERLEQQLGSMEQAYQGKLRHAENEANRLVADAKQQAMNIRTAGIEEAKHRARQILLEAEQGRGQLKMEAAKELNGQAVRQACQTLRELLSPDALNALHGQLVREVLEALSTLDAPRPGQPVAPVHVRSGLPLGGEETRRLAEWVRQRYGEAPLDVVMDPGLVAGCSVQVGTVTVDNSLPNRVGRGL